MLFSWGFDKKEKSIWMILFLGGFLAGIAGICLFPEQLAIETGFLDSTFLNHLKNLDVDRLGLFFYSLRCRIGFAAALILLSAAGLAAVGIAAGLLWSGLSAGAVLTVLSMRYGVKGLLFFLSCILPQQLLFIPAYMMLMDLCMKRKEKRKILLPTAVVITGCLIESYVNPIIMKVVLKFF